MDIASRKQLIKNEIYFLEEEWKILAIAKILNIEDNDESPDWHLPLVKEAEEHYKINSDDSAKWEDLKKEWDEEIDSRNPERV